MIGDAPMMVPPLATGSVDNDADSVGLSANNYENQQVLSDRSRGRSSQQKGKSSDFKKAYLQVSRFKDQPDKSCN